MCTIIATPCGADAAIQHHARSLEQVAYKGVFLARVLGPEEMLPLVVQHECVSAEQVAMGFVLDVAAVQTSGEVEFVVLNNTIARVQEPDRVAAIRVTAVKGAVLDGVAAAVVQREHGPHDARPCVAKRDAAEDRSGACLAPDIIAAFAALE